MKPNSTERLTVPCTDFNHHQSGTSEKFNLGDASSLKVQIDDAKSPDAMNIASYARDAQFSNFRKTMTFDTKYRRK